MLHYIIGGVMGGLYKLYWCGRVEWWFEPEGDEKPFL